VAFLFCHLLTAIEWVEKTLSQLADKRERALKRSQEISAERAQIGYAAHAKGDQKAIKRLEQLNLDVVNMSGEVASIDAAIAEAQKRLAAAQQAANRDRPSRTPSRYATC
jgi:predicted translin family RNA/ssDNA-binding protein